MNRATSRVHRQEAGRALRSIRSRVRKAHLLALGLALAASISLRLGSAAVAATAPPPRRATGLALETVAEGLQDPLYLTAPAGDPRLFVVEQPGRIRIIE